MYQLNNLDIIILFVIGISALIALSRGLVKEVLSIIGWVLGTIAVIYILPVLTPFAKSYIETGWLAGVVTALFILILFLIVWILFTGKIVGSIRRSKLSGLDRMLGLFFGIARACLLVILFYILISWMIPGYGGMTPPEAPHRYDLHVYAMNADLPLKEGFSEKELKEADAAVVIIDSIQTMYLDEVESTPGSVTQVRACSYELIKLAKRKGFTLFLVGHVTKQGAIAGPRVLEHMVDTVLYFEGERGHHFRILRAVKNRYGATDEIGVFEMQDQGLVEVDNPSAIFK